MRSMVERDAPVLAEPGAEPSDSGSSLSDLAPPGYLALREREVSLHLMQASAPDGPGWSRAGPAGLSLRDAKRP